MMGTKTLSEIKAELREYLDQLPGDSPQAWLAKEIESARGDPARDVKVLEALLAVLDEPVKTCKKPTALRPAKHDAELEKLLLKKLDELERELKTTRRKPKARRPAKS